MQLLPLLILGYSERTSQAIQDLPEWIIQSSQADHARESAKDRPRAGGAHACLDRRPWRLCRDYGDAGLCA